MSQAKILKCQVATVVCQAASEASDAKRLARGASDKKVNCVIVTGLNGCEVAVQRNVWIMVFEDGARKRVDFGQERGPPAQRMPGDGCRFVA